MAKASFFKAVFLSGAAMAALAPVAALAGDPASQSTPAPSVILNGQMNFSDVQGLAVVRSGTTHGANAVSVAANNQMGARVTQGTGLVTSDQTANGNTRASSVVQAENAYGATVSVAQASGNAGAIEVCCGAVLGTASQTTGAGTAVTAASNVRVGSADTVVSSATAAGNAWGVAGANSYIDLTVTQNNASTVSAVSSIDACCNNGSLTSGATAVANSNRIVSESSTVYSGVLQYNTGAVNATSNVLVGSGTNVTSAASAGGNVASIDNRWGYAQMDGYQENAGAVNARSEVVINDWAGFAVSGANAIGNSAMVSNIGSDATLGMVQNNFGSAPVSAYASLQGSSSTGGVGLVNASAMGNAATVYSCAGCGDSPVKVEGYVSQYNYAPVTATAVASVGSAGVISASATAVGNSANFIVGSPRGH